MKERHARLGDVHVQLRGRARAAQPTPTNAKQRRATDFEFGERLAVLGHGGERVGHVFDRFDLRLVKVGRLVVREEGVELRDDALDRVGDVVVAQLVPDFVVGLGQQHILLRRHALGRLERVLVQIVALAVRRQLEQIVHHRLVREVVQQRHCGVHAAIEHQQRRCAPTPTTRVMTWQLPCARAHTSHWRRASGRERAVLDL